MVLSPPLQETHCLLAAVAHWCHLDRLDPTRTAINIALIARCTRRRYIRILTLVQESHNRAGQDRRVGPGVYVSTAVVGRYFGTKLPSYS